MKPNLNPLLFSLRMYTRLITRIETSCSRLGKDDKFQLFVCLAVHDRLLGRIVTDLTRAVAAQQVSYMLQYSDCDHSLVFFQLFEEHAFLREPTLSNFLSHILKALDDISVPVDPALKKTLEQHHLIWILNKKAWRKYANSIYIFPSFHRQFSTQAC